MRNYEKNTVISIIKSSKLKVDQKIPPNGSIGKIRVLIVLFCFAGGLWKQLNNGNFPYIYL